MYRGGAAGHADPGCSALTFLRVQWKEWEMLSTTSSTALPMARIVFPARVFVDLSQLQHFRRRTGQCTDKHSTHKLKIHV